MTDTGHAVVRRETLSDGSVVYSVLFEGTKFACVGRIHASALAMELNRVAWVEPCTE